MLYRFHKLRLYYYGLKNWWLSRYGLPVGEFFGSHSPRTGKGKFVSVYQRGPYIDIVDERTGELLRLVPYQPNHGVFLEQWVEGKLQNRVVLDLRLLLEQLPQRKR